MLNNIVWLIWAICLVIFGTAFAVSTNIIVGVVLLTMMVFGGSIYAAYNNDVEED